MTRPKTLPTTVGEIIQLRKRLVRLQDLGAFASINALADLSGISHGVIARLVAGQMVTRTRFEMLSVGLDRAEAEMIARRSRYEPEPAQEPVEEATPAIEIEPEAAAVEAAPVEAAPASTGETSQYATLLMTLAKSQAAIGLVDPSLLDRIEKALNVEKKVNF